MQRLNIFLFYFTKHMKYTLYLINAQLRAFDPSPIHCTWPLANLGPAEISESKPSYEHEFDLQQLKFQPVEQSLKYLYIGETWASLLNRDFTGMLWWKRSYTSVPRRVRDHVL